MKTESGKEVYEDFGELLFTHFGLSGPVILSASSHMQKMAAGKYQVSPAQLCLRFLLQNDIIPLPKSSSMERMKQNMDLFHFEISEEDVSRLATMPQAGWSGEHPDPELAQKNVV